MIQGGEEGGGGGVGEGGEGGEEGEGGEGGEGGEEGEGGEGQAAGARTYFKVRKKRKQSKERGDGGDVGVSWYRHICIRIRMVTRAPASRCRQQQAAAFAIRCGAELPPPICQHLVVGTPLHSHCIFTKSQ